MIKTKSLLVENKIMLKHIYCDDSHKANKEVVEDEEPSISELFCMKHLNIYTNFFDKNELLSKIALAIQVKKQSNNYDF